MSVFVSGDESMFESGAFGKQISVLSKLRYLKDLLKVEDGPAMFYENDDNVWYKRGIHHVEDNPTVIP